MCGGGGYYYSEWGGGGGGSFEPPEPPLATGLIGKFIWYNYKQNSLLVSLYGPVTNKTCGKFI